MRNIIVALWLATPIQGLAIENNCGNKENIHADGLSVSRFDITVADFHEAEMFYTAVFDWSFHNSRFNSLKFIHNSFGENIGGVHEHISGGGGGIILHFQVHSVVTTFNRALSAGGSKVLDPYNLENNDGFAIFSDPWGNKIAIKQNGPIQ